MRERWAGPIVVALVLAGVIVILALNLNLKRWKARELEQSSSAAPSDSSPEGPASGARRLPDSASIRSATRSRSTGC